MSEAMEKALVPKLRFPEFLDSGEWQKKALSEVFIESPRPIKMKDQQDYSLVTVKRRYGGVVSRGVFKGESIKVKSQFSLERNDFLISKRQIVHNACGVVPESLEGAIVSNEYSVLVAREGFDISFLNYFSQQRAVSESFLQCSVGIVIEKMLFKLQDWLKTEFLFPPFKEQQKIAGHLLSIDKQISLHIKKYEGLKQHKKGLMQNLFTFADELVPRLRFPEFQSSEEWIEMKLSEITSFSSGGTPSKSVPEYWDGNIPWISASSMHTTCLSKSDHNITQFAVDKGARIVPKGTLLLLVRGSMLHKRIPVGITELDVAFNQDVKALKLKKDILESFLLYLFIASEQRLLGAVTKTGIGAGKLDTNDLNDLLVRIPVSKIEQQKIADSLISIDNLITAQAKKIEALKAHKKGLMQQLFPASDEVTS